MNIQRSFFLFLCLFQPLFQNLLHIRITIYNSLLRLKIKFSLRLHPDIRGRVHRSVGWLVGPRLFLQKALPMYSNSSFHSFNYHSPTKFTYKNFHSWKTLIHRGRIVGLLGRVFLPSSYSLQLTLWRHLFIWAFEHPLFAVALNLR